MAASTARMLFVTGMQRSGTTLVDKLLAAHPALSVLSQPFPLLFVETKRAFLKSRQRDDRYPLGHFFGEVDHDIEDVTAFLRGYRLGPKEVSDALDLMSGFSGQYTKVTREDVVKLVHSLPSGELYDVLLQLYRGLTRDHNAVWCGGKETLCEEFIPYLSERGARVVLIIRDPRAVICSLNHGNGESWAGSPKPTLFNVRHWRKSVAVGLAFRNHPRVSVIRYEDLVASPRDALGTIAALLEVAEFPDRDLDKLTDQGGNRWMGNSSFDAPGPGLSDMERYKRVLSPAVSRYVEATCMPELRALGYETTMNLQKAATVIRGFKEPYSIEREGLERYTDDPANVAMELRRLEALAEGVALDEPGLFVTDGAGRILAGSLA